MTNTVVTVQNSVNGITLSYAKLADSREHVTHLPGTLAVFRFQNCFLLLSLDIFFALLRNVPKPNNQALSLSVKCELCVYLHQVPNTKTQKAAMLILSNDEQNWLRLVRARLPQQGPITSEFWM